MRSYGLNQFPSGQHDAKQKQKGKNREMREEIQERQS